MRQITIELPLSTLPAGSIPEELLQKALMLRFLRLDFSGFLLVCRVQKNDLKSLMASLKAHYKQINQGHIKLSHECQEILLISGHWWNDGRAAYAQEENFAKLDVIYRSRTNFLSSPEVVGDCLRIILVGNPQSLKVLQATFSKVGLKYNVRKICGLEGNIASVLYRLTPQQMRILSSHRKRLPRLRALN